jgi:excisionase family DNA binding protein
MTTSLLTVDDVAAMLGMGRDWVYAEVRADRIPHIRLGRYVRFLPEAIEEWLRTLERGTLETTPKSPSRPRQRPEGMAQGVVAP